MLCSKCGKENEGVKFCGECGNSLVPEEVQPKPTKAKKKIFSWFFGITFFLAGLVTVFNAPIAGFLMWAIAAILLPPSGKIIENKLKFSKTAKIVVIILLFMITGMCLNSPAKTTTNKEKNTSDFNSELYTSNTASYTETTPEVKPKSSPETESKPEPEPIPVEKKWTTVKKWAGNGMKKTEVFEITEDSWRIKWKNKGGDYGGGVFQIMVYRPGNDMVDEIVANTTEVGSDTSYIYKSGEFYLNINSANTRWEIEIQEEK